MEYEKYALKALYNDAVGWQWMGKLGGAYLDEAEKDERFVGTFEEVMARASKSGCADTWRKVKLVRIVKKPKARPAPMFTVEFETSIGGWYAVNNQSGNGSKSDPPLQFTEAEAVKMMGQVLAHHADFCVDVTSVRIVPVKP